MRLCAAIVLLAAAPASARTLVVDQGSELGRAVETASAGDRILVRRGSYPALRLDGVRPRATVTVAAYPGDQPRVGGLDVKDSAHLRLEGLRISDIAQIAGSRDLALVGNDVTPHGFVVSHSSRLRFEGNHVHDLTIDLQPAGVPGARCNMFTPQAGLAPRCGFGFRLVGVSDTVITGNEIDHVPADGLQGNGLSRVEITGNRFHDINPSVDPAEHSEAIQLIGPNADVTVRRNRFQDTRGLLATPMPGGRAPGAAARLVVSDNTFFRIRHWAVHLLDATGARITGNTIWDASTGIRLNDDPASPAVMEGVELTGNVVCSLDAKPGMIATSRDNVIGYGPLGPGDTRTAPAFADLAAGDLRLVDGPALGAPDETAAPAALRRVSRRAAAPAPRRRR
jgi:hypothetical protein